MSRALIAASIWTLAAAFAAFLSGAAVAGDNVRTRVTLVLTSDVYKMEEANGRGGLARIAAALAREKAAHDNVLTFHAGDTLSPSLMSGFDKGAHIVELFNMAPLDVFVPGNHEFDFGPDIFRERMAGMRARVLAANLRDSKGGSLPGIADSQIHTFGELKIGVIGLTDEDSPVTSKPGSQFRFSGSLDAAEREAARLRRAGADIVVVVAHAGRARDEDLFNSGAADVILSGHDHDLYMRYNGQKAIIEAGEDGMFLAAIDLDIDVQVQATGQRRVRWWPQFRFIDTAGVAPDPSVAARVSAHAAKLDAETGQPLATTSTELDSRNAAVRGGEAAIANLFTDAIRAASGADVALLNGGGFRGGKVYPAGSTLSQRDVLTELPFLNKAYVLEVSGAVLRAALEQGFAGAENEVGRFPQVSGLKVRADLTRPDGRRVVSVLVNGVNLQPKKRYRLVTNEYLAGGGDGYTALRQGRVLMGDADAPLIANVVSDYLRVRKVVSPKFEGRIIVARSRPAR